MTEFKRRLREYAERELELTGFMATEFGKTCLQFLDDLADVAGEDPESMKTVAGMLTRLIDRQPLSEITEKDFNIDISNKRDHMLKTERYDFIYQINGKYYDDRYIAYLDENNNEMYLYGGGQSSKSEVTLPYFPLKKFKKL